MDSDELLIQLMCEENEDAKREFRNRYLAYIRMWLKQFKSSIDYFRLDEEDFVSEAYIKVYDALSVFDKDSVNFYSFAKRCVVNYMNSYIKKMNGFARRAIYDSLSIDSSLSDAHTFENMIESEYHITSLDEMVSSRENANRMKRVVDQFSDEEKNILSLKYAGKKAKEISGILSIKDKSVEYKCSSIKKKLTSCIKT